MTSIPPSVPPRSRPLGKLDPRRALWRALISIAIGILGGVALSLRFGVPVAVLGGWDIGGLVLLTLAWLNILRCDHGMTEARAGAEDPGRTAVYALVILTSFISLFAATVLTRRAHTIAAGESTVLIALCLLTVALSWLVTHTSFTLRYAHLYYREDREGVGGVEFPGDTPPTYFDFAYFAFTVGMCFQVSDCVVTSAQVRRAVLVHAVLSFAYNTLILAFALQLVFGAVE